MYDVINNKMWKKEYPHVEMVAEINLKFIVSNHMQVQVLLRIICIVKDTSDEMVAVYHLEWYA